MDRWVDNTTTQRHRIKSNNDRLVMSQCIHDVMHVHVAYDAYAHHGSATWYRCVNMLYDLSCAEYVLTAWFICIERKS